MAGQGVISALPEIGVKASTCRAGERGQGIGSGDDCHPSSIVCDLVERGEIGGDQATKGARWMPRQKRPMKGAASCEKLRGAASRQ